MDELNRMELEEQARVLQDESEPYPFATILLPRPWRWLNYSTIAIGILFGIWLLTLICR